jgi:hypothetical protein
MEAPCEKDRPVRRRDVRKPPPGERHGQRVGSRLEILNYITIPFLRAKSGSRGTRADLGVCPTVL